MIIDKYIVIEGTHKNPNKIETLNSKTRKIHGPYSKSKAEEIANGLIPKNVDNFYHRAWVVKQDIIQNKVCEECSAEDESVIQNLMIHGYKICKSCNLSKTLFPI